MATPMVQPVQLQQNTEKRMAWKYEHRRESQEILPSLWCGPFQTSWSLDKLKAIGITHILCIAEQREQHLLRPKFPEHFVYYIANIQDSEDQNLIQIFPSCQQFIESAISQGGVVLVHCGDGISRGPAIVTAYVMTKTGLNSDEAFHYVQDRRFCIAPRLEFMRQLAAYEPIVRAREMMAAQQTYANVDRSSRRRVREDEEDDDDAMAEDGITGPARPASPRWGQD